MELALHHLSSYLTRGSWDPPGPEQWGQESAVGEDAESLGWRGRQGPEHTELYVSLSEWVWT